MINGTLVKPGDKVWIDGDKETAYRVVATYKMRYRPETLALLLHKTDHKPLIKKTVNVNRITKIEIQ